jgi:5-methylcytosine-specific restriction enzyme A
MKITKNQYIAALTTSGILKEGNQELLSILFFAPECESTAPEITAALGLGNEPGPANSKLGNLGKRIAKCLDLNLPKRSEKSPGWWQIVVKGEKRKDGFYWQLKEELAEALIDLNLLDSFDPKIFPEELSSTTYHEGSGKKVVVNKYERNPVARKICIKHYGAICTVCNFSFTKTYGEIGKNFIHVHHLTEISSVYLHN